jgi:hypothetical protein
MQLIYRNLKNNSLVAQGFSSSCEQKIEHCFLRTFKTCEDKTVMFNGLDKEVKTAPCEQWI